MDYFWALRETIPENKGYGQFSRKHFIWLIISFIFILASTLVYKDLDPQGRIVLRRSFAIILAAIEIIKLVIIARSEVSVLNYLPLEVCSFAGYSIMLDSIFPQNTFFPPLLVVMFLPAAFMAILFPTSTVLPAVNFFTIHQFVYHDLIVGYIVARFVCGEIPLSYQDVWPSILKILVLATVMYVVDTVFDKDFMFLRDPYGNPVLEMVWNFTHGGFAYTIGLVCFVIFMIHLFFGFFRIIQIILLR